MRKSSTVPVSVAKAVLIDQRGRALHLRRGGLTFDEIAAELAIDVKKARRLCSDAMEDARAQVAETAKELQALEVSRLDSMLNSIWDSAMRGNLAVIDRVIKIMERRAKMLGLDAQERLDSLTPEEIAMEAQRAIQQAMATSSSAAP
jgi:orotate phosphoribosyltransferase-like protein